MNLPDKFKFLANEPGPKMLIEALKLYGIKEVIGGGNNPTILEWAKETGLDKEYKEDRIPWCGLFMAVVAKRAGKVVPRMPLYALNWATFGLPADTAKLGDILTFYRYDANGKLVGGHVGLYVGENQHNYFVLGGNQGDAVSIVEIKKTRIAKVRRPQYNVVPANVRPLFISSSGVVSTNEA